MYVLEETKVNRAFQLSVELMVGNTIYGAVKYNSTIIYNWVKRKFAGLQMPDRICNFTKNRMGQDVNIIYEPEEPYFCMKASHPDSTIPGRIWNIEAEIIVVNQHVMLGVKLSYSTCGKMDENLCLYSVPGFVKQIAEHNGIMDGHRLFEDVWDIKKDDDIEELYDFIQNHNRKLPIVVITENEGSGGIGGQYTRGYLVDADVLLHDVGIIAHIVKIPCNMIEQWNGVTERKWGVYGGAVRTYYPGADFLNDDYMSHPLSVVSRIMSSYYVDENGTEFVAGAAFERIIIEKLQRYNTEMRLDWKRIGHRFFFAKNREKLQMREKELLDNKQLQMLYDEEIKGLEEAYANSNQELQMELQENEKKKKELVEARDIIRRLNNRIDVLEYQLLRGRGEEPDIPILNDYSKMQNWVETYFPGRVVLHNRAIRSLKEAEFEDAELIFKCIKLLGTSYYKMRNGVITREQFESECRELGVEETGAITDISAGEFGEQYYINYHNAKMKLERHLRKGSSREAKYCLRIYFCWCEEESVVVVGSLPQHLDIRSS